MTYTPEEIRENIQTVIDWLESPAGQSEFNMRGWNCGTAMCIGGYIEARLFGREFSDTKCGAAIGLGEHDIDSLFYMYRTERHLDEVTPAIAAQCMKNLRDEDVVDWDRAFAEVEEGA